MSQKLKDIGGGFKLMPCAKGVCQECAVDHPAEFPHNQQSMYYQYHFFADHQRWPTWADAMAHCDDRMKAFWIKELAKKGIAVTPTAPDRLSIEGQEQESGTKDIEQ